MRAIPQADLVQQVGISNRLLCRENFAATATNSGLGL